MAGIIGLRHHSGSENHAGLVWATLGVGERFANLVGKTGLNIATRIMGLLLAAIAVSFIAQGMRSLLPGLGHV